MSVDSAKSQISSLQSQIHSLGIGQSAVPPDALRRVLGEMVRAMGALADAVAEIDRRTKK